MINADDFEYWTDRQRRIYGVIAEKQKDAADLYLGAPVALNDIRNPIRLVLVAHALRELTKHLPTIFNAPVPGATSLGNIIQNKLKPLWMKALKSKSYSDGKWEGEIDAHIRDFLRTAQELFPNTSSYRDSVKAFIKNLDPSPLSLPDSIREQQAKAWIPLLGYFNNVAHRAVTTEEEFRARLDELENLLLTGLARTPSADFSAIDAILSEDEQHA